METDEKKTDKLWQHLKSKKINRCLLPTPVHPLANLSTEYHCNIFCKRDDLNGPAMGGNKNRKLEYLFWKILSGDYNCVLTSGSAQSNHCRQTAYFSSMEKLECHLLLGGSEKTQVQGNLFLDRLSGAQLHFQDKQRKGEGSKEIQKALEKEGKKCFNIPYGGSDETGALAYIEAFLELSLQCQDSDLQIDEIFMPTSSGGTLAGLVLGKLILQSPIKITGIKIDKEDSFANHRDFVGGLIQKMIAHLPSEFTEHIDDAAISDAVQIDPGFQAGGYGNLSNPEKRIIRKLAQEEAILLDPVYTVKAMNGMLTKLLEQTAYYRNRNVLFWHTGGQPALFAYADEILT